MSQPRLPSRVGSRCDVGANHRFAQDAQTSLAVDPLPQFKNETTWQENRNKEVELSVKCRGLKDADKFSKSDPMVVMFVKSLRDQEWREFGRTETIDNTLNPDFVKKFVIEYIFTEKQELKFEVYNIDSKSPLLKKHDFLGRITCFLSDIVTSKYSGYEEPLRLNSKAVKGLIIITAEELDKSADHIYMKWKGTNLDKKDLFGKSDPFMVFSRCNEDQSYTVCHKTEVIKKTLNPTWKEMVIPARTLCNGDFDRDIMVQVYDWDRDGGHDLIGVFATSIRQLERGPSNDNIYECINEKKKRRKKNYRHSGLISLLQFHIQKQPTFFEYIRCGTELSFIVAIDFTDSNGDPNKPDSLHYIKSSERNQYAIAIEAVGEVVQEYDTDRLFPTYGFGARIPPEDRLSHSFPINFNENNPSCKGIAGVMQAYQDCIRKVKLDGPTNFSPIIRKVSEMAGKIKDASEYFVLLIITDGVISDKNATKEAIVNAAKLPVSIIIVGVGNADFTDMEELDGDNVRLSFNHVEAERDIVQFVPLRDHIGDRHNNVLSRARLAKEVLEEIPDQFVEYMRKRNLKPKTKKFVE